MNKQALFCQTYPDTHPKTLKFFPNFDYRNPAGDRSVLCDMSNPGNQVGEQQRSFSAWWAIEKCGPLDLGLDLGSHKGMTPFCTHVDVFGTGQEHPFYGTVCQSNIVWDAAKIHEIVPQSSLPYITANHSLEHMAAASDDEIVDMLVRWVGLLRPSGVLAMIVPDNDFFDVWACDKDHKHVGSKAWGHLDFRERVLDKLLSQTKAPLLEYNTLNNNFSFDIVLERR